MISSSPSRLTMAHSTPPAGQPDHTALSAMNLEQSFHLIHDIFSVESCLFHQVLPLHREEGCLTLGMVDLEDRNAIAYVRKMIAHLKLNLNVQQIDPKTHQLILSAYIKHSQATQYHSPTSDGRSTPPIPLPGHPPHKDHHHKTVFDLHDAPTLIVDREEEETPYQPPIEEKTRLQPSHTHLQKSSPTLPPHSPQFSPPLGGQTKLVSPEKTPSPVEIESHDLSSPKEALSQFSPQQIWQELLFRVLSGGIGRLYFEREDHSGRILLSQDGVLKLSLNKLSLKMFEGVFNYLKHLAQLPITPVNKQKKIEMEKYYQGERILLRFQISPGKSGEEGTLQVLRGKALQFYQQKQMDDLGEEALQLGQTLERKLRQIVARRSINPCQVKCVAELQALEEKIKYQLELLQRN